MQTRWSRLVVVAALAGAGGAFIVRLTRSDDPWGGAAWIDDRTGRLRAGLAAAGSP